MEELTFIRETYRSLVGDEVASELDRLAVVNGEEPRPDVSGLMEDLAHVAQVLFGVSGRSPSGEGQCLVAAPAVTALAELVPLVLDTEDTQFDADPEGHGLRAGLVVPRPKTQEELLALAVEGAYEKATADDGYPPQDVALRACAADLNWIAGRFREVDQDELATVCQGASDRIAAELDRFPAIVESVRRYAARRFEKRPSAKVADAG